jgi:hypothetical protein
MNGDSGGAEGDSGRVVEDVGGVRGAELEFGGGGWGGGLNLKKEFRGAKVLVHGYCMGICVWMMIYWNRM